MSTATMKDVSGLYREVRGQGPAVLFIAGATGDAGHFAAVAERLADEFTVITYDRRGQSRSEPGSAGADVAAIAAQADDAAALIKACGQERAVIFGTSGGAVIALDLIARDPDCVRGALLHEPALIALAQPMSGPDPVSDLVELARHDAPAALEAFVRLNSSDAAWTAIEPATRSRMLGNAHVLFDWELHGFLTYRPDADALRASGVEIELLHSEAGQPFVPAVNAWLRAELGLESEPVRGHHAPYFDTPTEFAEALRPRLRRLAMR